MSETLGKLRPTLHYKFWAQPGQDQTLKELRKQMEAVGNTVLKVDRKGNRLLLAQRVEDGTPQWGCRICLEAGVGIIVCDTEAELTAHADNEHPGWRGRNGRA